MPLIVLMYKEENETRECSRSPLTRKEVKAEKKHINRMQHSLNPNPKEDRTKRQRTRESPSVTRKRMNNVMKDKRHLHDGWGETTRTLVPWRQEFRHPTRIECMLRFAQILHDLKSHLRYLIYREKKEIIGIEKKARTQLHH